MDAASTQPGDPVTPAESKYPAIRVKTFASRVYEYYDPEVSTATTPVQLEVEKPASR